ncbi:MAG: TRZ/ATZ family hydrolase, partial [Pseudomonadales bacterium]|nr:TRZ/ATZ family hydrolase [Pseudomonadales bacterium]
MLTSSPPAAGPDQTGLVIQPEWIAPVIPRNTVYEQYSLVILDDKILDLLPNAQAKLKYPDWPIQRLPQQLLIPGFINSHGHMAMTLLRGYADD